jgi:hypothetical protein
MKATEINLDNLNNKMDFYDESLFDIGSYF